MGVEIVARKRIGNGGGQQKSSDPSESELESAKKRSGLTK